MGWSARGNRLQYRRARSTTLALDQKERKNSLFAGDDDGAEHCAVIASIGENVGDIGLEVDAEQFATVQGWAQRRIDELMPWAWKAPTIEIKGAA
jgi:hypothetical protein